MEELGFRGYPLFRLTGRLGFWSAQFIVAAMFGFYHFLQGWPLGTALIGTGLGSLLYGMAAFTSRGLALPIGLHAAWNFGDWALGDKGDTGPWRMVVPENFRGRAQLVGMIGYCAVTLVTILVFWLRNQRNQILK